MPTDGDGLETRVAALERAVAELRQRVTQSTTDAAAARVLAAGADRDVSEVRAELRAHTGALTALRETQLEFRETQLDHGERLSRIETETREGFATVGVGMAEITALLRRVIREQ